MLCLAVILVTHVVATRCPPGTDAGPIDGTCFAGSGGSFTVEPPAGAIHSPSNQDCYVSQQQCPGEEVVWTGGVPCAKCPNDEECQASRAANAAVYCKAQRPILSGYEGPGPPPSTKWWSSMVYKFYTDDTIINHLPAYPHGIVFKEDGSFYLGVAFGYTATPGTASDAQTDYLYQEQDYFVGIAHQGCTNCCVKDDVKNLVVGGLRKASDWIATVAFNASGGASMDITLGSGLANIGVVLTDPTQSSHLVVCGTFKDVNINGTKLAWTSTKGVQYVAHTATACSWMKVAYSFGYMVSCSSAVGPSEFSLGILPDNTDAGAEAMFDRYMPKTLQHSTCLKSHLSWNYDLEEQKVKANYSFNCEGRPETVLTALFPHQYDNLARNQVGRTKYTYHSPRGTMVLYEVSSFVTSIRHRGVVPTLPTMRADPFIGMDGDNSQMFHPEDVDPLKVSPTSGYWTSKEMFQWAEFAMMAHEYGAWAKTNGDEALYKTMQMLSNAWTTKIVAVLTNWFTAKGPTAKGMYCWKPCPDHMQFYYNAEWGMLVPFPEEPIYGQASQFADIHLFTGYLIYAMATVGYLEIANTTNGLPASRFLERTSGIGEMLIRNVMNPCSAVEGPTDAFCDVKFPRLRNFDPYVGLSWDQAHGDGNGNVQASSSEATLFYISTIWYASLMPNVDPTPDKWMYLRDLATHVYSTQTEAIRRYSFGHGRDPTTVGPYAFSLLSNVEADGGSWRCYLQDNSPYAEYAINALPITGGSFYLNFTEYIAGLLHDLESAKSVPGISTKVNMMRVNVKAAMLAGQLDLAAKWARGTITTPGDDTTESMWYWYNNIKAKGRYAPQVTATNTLFYTAFLVNKTYTYIAHNPAAHRDTPVCFHNPDCPHALNTSVVLDAMHISAISGTCDFFAQLPRCP